MKIKTYLRILLVLLITLTAKSSLTAQEYSEKEWKTAGVEGDFEIRSFERFGNKIVMSILKNDGKVPCHVNGQVQTAPIIIYDMVTGKLLSTKNNWVGDPLVMIFKDQIHKISDSVYVFQSNNRIIRAEIKNDSVVYTETFQLGGLDGRVFSFTDKNNLYFCKPVDKEQCIYICNKMGNLIKKRPINGFKMQINSISENKGGIFIGYEYTSWGGYDGIGVASVDLNTGNATTLPSPEIENLSGSKVESILGRLFLTTDAYKYPQDLLYERIGNDWIPLSGINAPYEKDGKLYAQFFKGQVYMPTNDTITADEVGYRELPTDLSLGLGTFLNPTNHAFDPFTPDPRTTILFSDSFRDAFGAKYGYQPVVDFVYEYVSPTGDSIVYGIGSGGGGAIIAYLGTKTDEVKTSKVDLPRFTIYPNPANDVISVNNLPKEVIYTITNYVGEVLLSNTTVDKIDISNLPTGLYFLNLNGYKSERFTKK